MGYAPYLGRPNYSNAMNNALRTKLAYDESGSSTKAMMNKNAMAMFMAGVRGSGGGASGGTDRVAPFSPEARAEYRNAMAVETEKELALEKAAINNENIMAANERADVEQELKSQRQAADLKKMESDTKRSDENSRVVRLKNVADTVSHFASAATVDTVPDLLDWVGEETGWDTSFTKAKFADMSDVEKKVYLSKLQQGSAYAGNINDLQEAQIKAVEAAEKTRLAEEKIEREAAKAEKTEMKAAEKAKAAARKEAVRIYGKINTADAAGGLTAAQLVGMPPKAIEALRGADQSQYKAILKEYVRQLKEEHGFELDVNVEEFMNQPDPTPLSVVESLNPGESFIGKDGRTYIKK